MNAVEAQNELEKLEMNKMPAKDFTFLGKHIPECDQNRNFLRTGEVRVWVTKDQNGRIFPKLIAAADMFRLLGYGKSQAYERALRSNLLIDGIADADIVDKDPDGTVRVPRKFLVI